MSTSVNLPIECRVLAGRGQLWARKRKARPQAIRSATEQRKDAVLQARRVPLLQTLTSTTSWWVKMGGNEPKEHSGLLNRNALFYSSANLLFQLMSQSKSLFCGNLKDINSGHWKEKKKSLNTDLKLSHQQEKDWRNNTHTYAEVQCAHCYLQAVHT